MRALVVYESMYGNTHTIADGIAEGLQPSGEVRLVAVGDATPDLVAWADFVIAGGPTHAHGMSKPSSRSNARETAAKPDGWTVMKVDPAAEGPGVREWLEALAPGDGKPAAAFDTRAHAPAVLTGRASSGIAKGLRGRGYKLVVDPESFIVDTHNQLMAGEREHATKWAASLAAELVAAT